MGALAARDAGLRYWGGRLEQHGFPKGALMISRRAFCVLTGVTMLAPQRSSASESGGARKWLQCVRDVGAAARIGARLQGVLGDGTCRMHAESVAGLTHLAGSPSPERL